MKNYLIVVSGLLVVIIVLGIITVLKPAQTRPNNGIQPTPKLAENTPSPHPDKNIEVDSPVQNQKVDSEIIISGRARVFENVINYRIKDTQGNTLSEGYLTAASPDVGQYGDYYVKAKYKKPATDYGVVEVYWLSPKDGSEIDKQVIYVQFP